MRTFAVSLLALLACARDDAHPVASAPTAGAAPVVYASALQPEVEPAPVLLEAAVQPEPAPTSAVRLVDLDPADGSLREQIIAAAAQAKADGRTAVVELWASWCPPCKKLDQLVRAGPVAEAVANAVLIRVDTDVFGDELNALGYTAPEIPSLYHVDGRGKPRGKPMSGAKWSRASEVAIAEQLVAFVAR